jgi:hypothetical protein
MNVIGTVGELERFVERSCGLRIAVARVESSGHVPIFVHGRTHLESLTEFNRSAQPLCLPALRADMSVEEAESAFRAAWGLRIEIFLKSGSGQRARDKSRIDASSIGFHLPARDAKVSAVAARPPRVFISYRRDGGSELAQLVCQFLEGQRVPTFLDVENLGAGRFGAQIEEQLEQSTHVVLICSKGALAKRGAGEDWLYAELRTALRSESVVVIPFLAESFEFPAREELPDGLRRLLDFQGFSYTHQTWRAMRSAFLEMIIPRTQPDSEALPASVPPS